MRLSPLALALAHPLFAQQGAPVPAPAPEPAQAAAAAAQTAKPAANPRPEATPDPSLLGGSLDRAGVLLLDTLGKPAKKKWDLYLGKGEILPLSLAEGKVWACQSGESKIHGLDPATGKEVFTYEAEQNLFSSPLVSGGLLYFGTKRFGLAGGNSRFWVVDIASKQVKQEEKYSFMLEIPTPTILDGQVYHASGTFTGNTKMMSTDLAGKETWSEKVGGGMPGIYAMKDGRGFFFMHQKWANGMGGRMFYNLNQTSFDLLAEDLKTGKILWSTSGSTRNHYVSVAENLVLVGTRDSLEALSAAKGDSVWSLTEKKANFSAAAVSGNQVFTGSAAGWAYALDLHSGKVLWKAKLEGADAAQPVVAGNLVLFPVVKADGFSGMIQAFDKSTGAEAWRLSCEAPATPLLVTHEGILFGTATGSVVDYQ